MCFFRLLGFPLSFRLSFPMANTSSDYSVKIWDSSHALSLKRAEETSAITDDTIVVEMKSSYFSLFSLYHFIQDEVIHFLFFNNLVDVVMSIESLCHDLPFS